MCAMMEKLRMWAGSMRMLTRKYIVPGFGIRDSGFDLEPGDQCRDTSAVLVPLRAEGSMHHLFLRTDAHERAGDVERQRDGEAHRRGERQGERDDPERHRRVDRVPHDRVRAVRHQPMPFDDARGKAPLLPKRADGPDR